jgi:hypothetical protein
LNWPGFSPEDNVRQVTSCRKPEDRPESVSPSAELSEEVSREVSEEVPVEVSAVVVVDSASTERTFSRIASFSETYRFFACSQELGQVRSPDKIRDIPSKEYGL